MTVQETFLNWIPVLSVALALVYNAINVKNANMTQKMSLETRQAQLFMNIYDTWTSKENQLDLEKMWCWDFRTFDEFFDKCGPETNPDDHAIWDCITSRLDGIGVLLKRGLIEPNLTYDLLYGSVIELWKRFIPVILEYRDRNKAPEAWADLEYLYHEMVKIKKEKSATAPP